ncbi:substrate-binding domain-containing protein [Streptomyces rapamycinicus]|uniref:Sugar ABC transporter n=2 Tax=Streptomyces rapamycinicus TaxID=1226757 RepID=A0A3L8RBA0_STRRN|nr:substrate-binding domain-containing protein [Streptomyces rapamycinicus]MBB4788988.1 fructose transport system substrate-binding protein [Streptomyces rapamycinicus]RLV76959.1 sugar ABC transporter [Streptomyces rapamycinicus NRRL 5491]UTO67531.1 substrate-binding domain-containing protein [Streptomyces rapamycinicus]UTP35485.1 substrate-binding domain-containing protein [Streptomyces rapamycinicus NRRL 5491]
MADRVMPRHRALAALSAGIGLTLLLTSCGSGLSGHGDDKTIVGLVTKTNDNPFYVKMREGAQKKARQLGVDLRTFAGKGQADNDSQVKAIENLVAAGAKGILITPADSGAIIPAIDRARKAGVMVVALDSPTEPASAVDATFATDNRLAGRMIGKWAKARMAGKRPRVALLDLSSEQVKVDVLRDQGFLEGFGVDVRNPNRIGDERDSRIVGHEVTGANEEGGRDAMEKLLQKDGSINLVYTINEPTAAGAYQAVKAAGKQKDITIVSVDGGCPGVKNVAGGVIGATSMQFPVKMAADGLAAVAAHTKDGGKGSGSSGQGFTNTGVSLITDTPVSGLDSQKSDWGLRHCWG